MKQDLVTINQISTNPRYSYLELTRFNIQKLEQYGFITVLKEEEVSYVSIVQLENHKKVEKEFFDNHVSFLYFIEKVFKLNKTTPKNIYKLALIKNSCLKLTIKMFMNKEYVSKQDYNNFFNTFIHKIDVLNQLGISESLYQQKLVELNICETPLTPRSRFIYLSDYKTLKINVNKDDYLNDNHTWLVAARVIKDKRYKHIASNVESLLRIAKAGHIKYYTNSDNVVFVEERTLNEYAEEVLILKNDYYMITKVTKLLGIKQFNISQLSKSLIPNLLHICYQKNIDVKYYEIPIQSETLYIHRKSFDQFLLDHISNNQIVKDYQLEINTLNRLVKRFKIKRLTLHYTLSLFNKKEIEQLFENSPHPLAANVIEKDNSKLCNYYNFGQVKSLLSATQGQMVHIRKEEQLSFEYYQGTTIYFKGDIDKLLEIQTNAKEKYYTSSYIYNKLGAKYINLQRFKACKVSTLIRAAFNTRSSMHFYLKSDIEPYINNHQIKRQISELELTNPKEVFLHRIKIESCDFLEKNTFTYEQWMNYCMEKLESSSTNTSPTTIPKLVNCSKRLTSFLNDEELYKKQTTEINFALFRDNVPITHQHAFYGFLNKLSDELSIRKLPLINIKKIWNPYKKETPENEKAKEIYTYEEYKKIFDYVINIDKHKKIAIEDAMDTKNNQTNTYYASSWFYVMMHLNNAWRHQDICTLPCIELKELNINSLEQFKDINLSLKQAQQIINQIITMNLTVSKTNVTNQFFCSEELKIPLATAAIICQLINNQSSTIKNHLIDFGNKNQKFSRKSQKKFFSNFVDKSFIFENRKFNRTLLSFMYSLLVNNGHGGAALEVAQRLRAHKDQESTNIYIKIPENEFNYLSRQLFKRNHFGYIPSLFLDTLNDSSLTYNQKTNNIVEINKIMGGIYGIEVTSGFINSILSEKKTIMDMVLSMGKEEVLDFLFKIDCELLPSKEENFQCLLSETGCIKPFENCRRCAYSIPNFYALSAITESISQLLINFSKDFQNTLYDTEKIKLANLLFREIDILFEACVEFGQEEVFQFFKGNKEGYFNLLDLLDDVTGNYDLKNYLTYKPT
ncbi:hypothetical protein [Bacillus sp. 2205SS5-2]|uniref:hypothetical protein n=1 Tax=Bacillus sp. 2205SS5-2 TaxID=3109031 RepID=UPI0030057555